MIYTILIRVLKGSRASKPRIGIIESPSSLAFALLVLNRPPTLTGHLPGYSLQSTPLPRPHGGTRPLHSQSLQLRFYGELSWPL